MDTARIFVDSYNAIAQDWAQTQSGRRLGSLPPVRGVSYRRSWPDGQVLDALGDLDTRPALAANGWLDSTLDLRDGLSVIEVYADPDPSEVAPFKLELRVPAHP